MLIPIRFEIERVIGEALPDWKRFSARVQRISETELPCVNVFFHKDHLIKKGNFIECRQVFFEIEAGFKVQEDAEKELSDIREKIESAIESNQKLQRITKDLAFSDVDFLHDMAGASRVAILEMTARVEYERPLNRQAQREIKPKDLRVNGEKTDG